MTERPILFSGPMVRAILEGCKTQTRRLVKQLVNATGVQDVYHRPDGNFIGTHLPVGQGVGITDVFACPYGRMGDRLWVRETFAFINNSDFGKESYYEYRAGTDGKCLPGNWPDDCRDDPERPRWKPSIHMPRVASRIMLEITDIRAERLQDISCTDAEAEGVFRHIAEHSIDKVFRSERGTVAKQRYNQVWESINGKGSWDKNPWVWVVCFKRVILPDLSQASMEEAGRLLKADA